MNTTQTLAWLLCLLLAFFATIVAVRASYQAAVTEQRFDEVRQVAADQQELLGQIRDVLKGIERHLGSPAPSAQVEAAAGQATVRYYAE